MRATRFLSLLLTLLLVLSLAACSQAPSDASSTPPRFPEYGNSRG